MCTGWISFICNDFALVNDNASWSTVMDITKNCKNLLGHDRLVETDVDKMIVINKNIIIEY